MQNLTTKKYRFLKRRLPGFRLLAGLLLAMLFLLQPVGVRAETKISGIDVSKWQGAIDWAKVKAAGVQFVMLGTGRYQIPDPNFKYNIENAIAQDIPVGVYLYSLAATEEEARLEAMYVLDQIDGYKISYPVAFDLEDSSHYALSTAQRTDIAIAFLEVIEEAGYYPMLYASESWFTYYLDTARLAKYDKWVARYASSTSIASPAIWQYSCTGKVDGIDTNVDLNYSYRDYTQIITPRTKSNAIDRPAITTGWNTDGTRYWYVQQNGLRVTSSFLTLDGKTYYLDSSGYRVSGWQQIDGNYYYFRKSNGTMKTGWLNLNGRYYYLDSNGVRLTGWITVNGKQYYLNKKGVRQYKWLTLNGKKYWLRKADGSRKTGWLTMSSGKVYYFRKGTGEMVTGWMTLNSKTYYFKSSGVRASGWTKIRGKWYYFHPSNGVMQTNCTIGGYQIGPDGICTNR